MKRSDQFANAAMAQQPSNNKSNMVHAPMAASFVRQSGARHSDLR
jgi:hypothetical protein